MKYEQPEHCYQHPPIPTVVEAYENAFPTPQRIAARSSTGLKNMAAFFVSRAERTNEVCLCAYEVADILKEAADAIKQLERERDEARGALDALEERRQLKLSLEKIKLWAALPVTLSLWATAKNETRTALYLMRAIAHEAENALKENGDK